MTPPTTPRPSTPIQPLNHLRPPTKEELRKKIEAIGKGYKERAATNKMERIKQQQQQQQQAMDDNDQRQADELADVGRVLESMQLDSTAMQVDSEEQSSTAAASSARRPPTATHDERGKPWKQNPWEGTK